MSVFASGIAKLILGSTAVSLGAAGALVKLSFGEIKEESLKTTSIKSDKELNPENEKTNFEQLPESSQIQKSPDTESVVSAQIQSEPIAETECRLHKLEKENDGLFSKTTKEELKGMLNGKESYFREIEEACKTHKGKDIFVSNKQGGGWRYYVQDQERLKTKFNNYLQKVKTAEK
ncbi:hypothetical protein MHC_02385 [Mycoplasma haemocanis str. Illinois]|uniref:Uncharacterized protein n=1 Tax=Mycoplasma haemocanis (strain Illinois) TaxID=1111676 RepID=H6N6R9_MYCHN|nr:hypothetical protein [Mycoplasma haemocanis]AEW45341.1 hypothetical protein MHC_02385 [Mycoplasma haemocanis str. Illinois]